MTDALGNEIVIGKAYGYILKDEWKTFSIKGVAEKAQDGRVTLGLNESRDLNRSNSNFRREERRRSVNSSFLFPI